MTEFKLVDTDSVLCLLNEIVNFRALDKATDYDLQCLNRAIEIIIESTASKAHGGEVVCVDSSKELSPINAYLCEWPDHFSVPRLMFFGDQEVQRYRGKHKILALFTAPPRVVDEAMVERAIKGMSDYYARDDIFPMCPACKGSLTNGDDYCDCNGGSIDLSSEQEAMRAALKAALEQK